jgi:hypothetical protein
MLPVETAENITKSKGIKEKGKKFLTLITEGEQQQAEEMLLEYPWLANYKGNVIDLSKRSFKNITSFQYAVWALDWHMWSMMLKHMHENDIRKQLHGMETSSFIEHGSFASWQNLIDALDKFMEFCNDQEWENAKAQWRLVVHNAQQTLPTHVVNEYCHPTRSFVPCPDFTDDSTLPRSRKIENGVDWFTYLKDNQRAFIRNIYSAAHPCTGLYDHNISPDRTALATLLETRVAQCKQLLTDYPDNSNLISNLGFEKYILFRQFMLDKKYPKDILTAIFQKGTEGKAQEKGQQFLTLVTEGEQQQAEYMLLKYSWLANYKGDVIDLSKRSFTNITGFQYAVWALDWHMWSMMLKHIHKDDICKQLRGMETGSFIEHGSFASWQNLIDALDKFMEFCNDQEWKNAKAQWRLVVHNAQQTLPTHVVNEYCHPTRSFVPCPDFTDDSTLPRSRKIENKMDWFVYLKNNKCALIRNKLFAAKDRRCSAYERDWFSWPDKIQQRDSAVLFTLLKTRIAQRKQLLTDYLDNSNLISNSGFKKFSLFKRFILENQYPKGIAHEIATAVFQKGIEGKAQEKGQKFLALVTEGKQRQAEEMLIEYPWLANYKGDVIDLSERSFKNITGFQYAVWALDWHMWSMMLKHIHKDYICKQLRGMETGSFVEHGSFASWQNLIDAMDKNIELFNALEWEEADVHWCHVVHDAQLLLPTHVVNEYCNPTSYFKMRPNLKNDSSTLPRLREIKYGMDWFVYLKNNKRALIRHGYLTAYPLHCKGRHYQNSQDDRRILAILLEIRVAQRKQLLVDYLYNSEYMSRNKNKP